MKVMALDPGSSKSALVTWDTNTHEIVSLYRHNALIIEATRTEFLVTADHIDQLVIEYPKPRGQLGSSYLFDSIYLAGQVAATFEIFSSNPHAGKITKLPRMEAALYLTGSTAATPRQLKQGVIEWFSKAIDGPAVGAIKCVRCKGKGWIGRGRPACTLCDGSGWEVEPGPLYEFSKQGNGDHPWDALAVAVTWYNTSPTE